MLRDLDLLQAIQDRTRAVVSFTITTPDDALARKLEPGAPPPSARLAALETLARHGIETGVLLMPILPFLEDDPAAIQAIVVQAAARGASHVVPGFGVTLRDRQRDYFYARLDQHFPGLRARYEAAFGAAVLLPLSERPGPGSHVRRPVPDARPPRAGRPLPARAQPPNSNSSRGQRPHRSLRGLWPRSDSGYNRPV